MDDLLLHESDATVVLVDVQNVGALSSQLGPVDLAVVLSRFYEHIEGIMLHHRGRIVRFAGGSVLTVFIGGGASDHTVRGLAAVAEAVKLRPAFVEELGRRALRRLDYGVVAASGHILAGELGTDRLRFYDVLGQTVTHVYRLALLAARRDCSNLVDGVTFEAAKAAGGNPSGVEVDTAELEGDRLRLFKLDG